MKKILLLLLACAAVVCIHAQQSVGIGTSTPNSSAVLDLTSTTKGFLIPRMTAAQRTAITTPVAGLLVYQTNTVVAPRSVPGFYLFDGAAWKLLAKDEDIPPAGSSTSWTVSGNNQYSTPSGNVGIGVTSPVEKLDVNGVVRLSNGSDGGQLKLTGGSAPFFISNIDFTNNTGTIQNRITSAVGILGFTTPGHSDHLQLLPDGGVHVGSGAGGTNVLINGSGNTNPTLRLVDETPEIQFHSGANESGILAPGASLLIGPANPTGFLGLRTNSSIRFFIGSNGNVGINSVSPAEALHVNGHALINNTNATYELRSDGDQKGFVQLAGNDLRLGTFSSNTNAQIIFRNGGSDRMRVDGAGNVMVGNLPNVLAKLHVDGTTRIEDKLTINKNDEAIHIAGTNPAINFFTTGNVQRGYLWNTGSDMQLGTSVATGRLFLNASQVRVGTSIEAPADYKFAVGGKVICEELRVKLQSGGWPDYVFHKDYKLATLTEVEKYIKENSHLPNIPSAAEVEKNGIAVGDMQKRLIEKVEELTLYVIELEKKMNELKSGQK